MNQNFAAIILGGTGQVGGAAVAELLAIPECREVVMVTRKPIARRSRVRNVVLDTGAADFAERTAVLAREVLSQGPVSAVSCVGVGSGSRRWSEEELQRLEVGVVGAFARGCHDAGIAQFCLLSAAAAFQQGLVRHIPLDVFLRAQCHVTQQEATAAAMSVFDVRLRVSAVAHAVQEIADVNEQTVIEPIHPHVGRLTLFLASAFSTFRPMHGAVILFLCRLGKTSKPSRSRNMVASVRNSIP